MVARGGGYGDEVGGSGLTVLAMFSFLFFSSSFLFLSLLSLPFFSFSFFVYFILFF